jgi:cyclohexadienyl dehydratase
MPFVGEAKHRAGTPVEDRAQEERVLSAAAAAVARAAEKRGTPAPPEDAVQAFFRVEIQAAKSLQLRGAPPLAPSWSLEQDLRPAIARITARLAWLIARIPHETTVQVVTAQARDVLGSTGLDTAHVEAIASALAGLAR